MRLLSALAVTLIIGTNASAQPAASTPPPARPADQGLSALLAPGATVEKVVGDLGFTEGPLWMPGGYLLFTDIPRNRIMRWHPTEGLSVHREPSQQANGLLRDREGRLVAAEHAARRVSRTAADGTITTLVDRHEGKRLNSPNDLAQARDGSLYFTDPPYGLPQQKEGKELEVNGVYRLSPSGTLTLLASDFERPNGLGFSPDGKTLYVADTARQHVRAFDVQADGRLTNGRVFGVMTPWPGAQGGPDGLKVDARGHVFVTGAGGVWVFDAAGRTLGVIETPETPANCAFGDPDGKTLYITARTSVFRIRLR
ncbi:SMP-30/gluconolactonase/LRE family protein [Luteitalea sp.]|jgi:sugar lactone lactonase YvrE|uniref:SMP-30/gluconolactonase/LRE family protein n=1 Tax=Luteitalea sp. TaxID=2004800 RepID=UPI0037C8A097